MSEGSTTPGGTISAVVTAANNIALFLADSAGGVYTTSGNAADGWRPWTSVAEGRSTPGGTISAVLIAPKRVALFLADSEGGIYATELQLS